MSGLTPEQEKGLNPNLVIGVQSVLLIVAGAAIGALITNAYHTWNAAEVPPPAPGPAPTAASAPNPEPAPTPVEAPENTPPPRSTPTATPEPIPEPPELGEPDPVTEKPRFKPRIVESDPTTRELNLKSLAEHADYQGTVIKDGVTYDVWKSKHYGLTHLLPHRG